MEPGGEWICLDTGWVKSLRDRMQSTNRQKAQETSIIHSIHCGLVVACSLIIMLASSHKQTLCIDKKENKSCLLQIVYSSCVCLASAEHLPKSASGWKGKEYVCMPAFTLPLGGICYLDHRHDYLAACLQDGWVLLLSDCSHVSSNCCLTNIKKIVHISPLMHTHF